MSATYLPALLPRSARALARGAGVARRCGKWKKVSDAVLLLLIGLMAGSGRAEASSVQDPEPAVRRRAVFVHRVGPLGSSSSGGWLEIQPPGEPDRARRIEFFAGFLLPSDLVEEPELEVVRGELGGLPVFDPPPFREGDKVWFLPVGRPIPVDARSAVDGKPLEVRLRYRLQDPLEREMASRQTPHHSPEPLLDPMPTPHLDLQVALAPVAPEKYELRIEADGHVAAVVPCSDLVDRERIEVTLQPAAPLTVVHRQDPVVWNLRLDVLDRHGERVARRPLKEPESRHELDGLAPGPYRLELHDGQGLLWSRELALDADGEEVVLDLRDEVPDADRPVVLDLDFASHLEELRSERGWPKWLVVVPLDRDVRLACTRPHSTPLGSVERPGPSTLAWSIPEPLAVGRYALDLKGCGRLGTFAVTAEASDPQRLRLDVPPLTHVSVWRAGPGGRRESIRFLRPWAEHTSPDGHVTWPEPTAVRGPGSGDDATYGYLVPPGMLRVTRGRLGERRIEVTGGDVDLVLSGR